MTDTPVTRSEVARGAGLAGLSRLGALIEAVAQPVYTWLFGLSTYGIYVVLWGAVSLLTNLVNLSMTGALQRVVPTRASEAEAHGAVKLALLVGLVPATIVAALVSLNAESVASLFSVAPEDRAALPRAIAIFAWALPLWSFVEIATAAARARRAFGPEIRLRIFWEQLARLLFATGFFLLGAESTGLLAAHLCSLALTAALCVPLLRRYYGLRLLWRAPLPRNLIGDMIGTGVALLPSDLSRRSLIDGPPVLLNLMLPGAAGAAAAGLFEIARKLSTLPHIVRQAFQYVLAPLSSAQAAQDRAQIAPIYGFAARVSAALVVPLAGLLIFAGQDVLSVYRPEAIAALPLLWILTSARAVEAVVGPAATIVEMIGHRGLPLLNSLLAVGLWVVLAAVLVPNSGALGMAVAVASATVLAAAAAALELRWTERLMPLGRHLFRGLASAGAGLIVMAAAMLLLPGVVRFVTLLLLWAATTWVTLRLGLTQQDREALGSVSRRLRLIR